MGRQGLLFSEALETRWEQHCEKCYLIFSTIDEAVEHHIKQHIEPRTDSWYKEYLIKKWNKFKTVKRPFRRFNVSQLELDNRNSKLCHCGNNVVKPRRLYCSDKCSSDWDDKTLFWSQRAWQILSKNGNGRYILNQYGYEVFEIIYTCEQCGYFSPTSENFNVDHIIAIMNGGHPWDERNLQVLCSGCHKKKTKQDHEERKDRILKDSYEVLDDSKKTLRKKQNTNQHLTDWIQ